MNNINHKMRDEWYKNTSFYLKPLVNQRLEKFLHKPNGKGRYEGIAKHLITLYWEKNIIEFDCLDIEKMIIDFNNCIGMKLSDWNAIPNHSCENITLFFNDATFQINFNVFGNIHWINEK